VGPAKRRPHRFSGVQDQTPRPPRHPSQDMEYPSLNRGYIYVILSS
jgi:hypothetical protein